MEGTRKILIVDDDPVYLQTVSVLFKRSGFEVVSVQSGEKAMEILRTDPPHLVLLDIFMPRINGVEVLKFIRSDSRLLDLPVVVISTSSTTRHVDTAWRLGANKCVAKDHFEPGSLVTLIEEVLAEAKNKAPSGRSGPAARPEVEQYRAEFLKTLPEIGETLRGRWQNFINSENDQSRLAKLAEVQETVENIAESAEEAELNRLALLANTLLAMTRELIKRQLGINSSSARTMSQAVDLITVLFNSPVAALADKPPVSTVFVVDKQLNSLDLMAALRIGELAVASCDEAEMSVKLLEQNRFHAVFWAAEMPGISGSAACEKIRLLPVHRKTPFVLFTDLREFDGADRTTMPGVTDLMAKPFEYVELTVKALSLVLRDQLASYVQ